MKDIEGKQPVWTADQDLATRLQNTGHLASEFQPLLATIGGYLPAVSNDPHMGKNATAKDPIEGLVGKGNVFAIGQY